MTRRLYLAWRLYMGLNYSWRLPGTKPRTSRLCNTCGVRNQRTGTAVRPASAFPGHHVVAHFPARLHRIAAAEDEASANKARTDRVAPDAMVQFLS